MKKRLFNIFLVGFMFCLLISLLFGCDLFDNPNNKSPIAYYVEIDEVYHLKDVDVSAQSFTVLASHNNKPVEVISSNAFKDNVNLLSITIPYSIIQKNEYAIDGCTSLKVINYRGTKEQWQNIILCNNWVVNSSDFVIKCSDGDIPNSEAVSNSIIIE